ncbi:MAG: hypothetical protein M3135_01360 [Actinomycetota bacterium]|nr:hypothetical protein [Actinomycetota bacterium]
MRPRSLLPLAAVLLLAAPAQAEEPSASSEITIESPAGLASGVVPVRIRVSGGFRDAEQAAFHIRQGGAWNDGQRTDMTLVDEGVFEASWDSTELQNGSYRLEVRAWGEVPPYDPSDPSTFAGESVELAVDNAPPPPGPLQGVSPAAGIRIGWAAIPTSDRGDFDGYRIYVARGDPCPTDASAYQHVADVADPLYADDAADPGRYCLRVASARASAVTGSILSPQSGTIAIRVVRGAGGIGSTSTEAPAPPPPPQLGEGELDVSDGAFGEDLPYGPQTISERVGEGRAADGSAAPEAGADPRRTPTLIAAGLVLGVAALLIRRFLANPGPA